MVSTKNLMSTTCVLRIFLYPTLSNGRPQHLQQTGSCFTILSGVLTDCRVVPLWPGCPPLGLPLGLRRDFVLRSSRAAMLSCEGGTLLLLLFFSGFPDVPEEPSPSSSCPSSSLIRPLTLASSAFVEESSIFRLCISLSFWPMMRLIRPISSVFSESDFSSLRRRWFIKRKASSMSVHCLAISQAKIDIFCETAKSKFTSLNAGRTTSKNAEMPLVANNPPGDNQRRKERESDDGDGV